MDWRGRPSYANIKARLVYLHVAMSADLDTRTCAKSYRQLAKELGMTLGEVRQAVRQLVEDGLLTTHLATHPATHFAAHFTTQLTTHLTVVINNENGAPNGAPNNTPNNTPYNTLDNTPCDTQFKYLNNKNNKPFTLTDARALREKFEKRLSAELEIPPQEAAELGGKWLQRMEIKAKAWEGEADAMAHLVAWAEKHKPIQRRPRLSTAAADREARRAEDERRRQQEAAATEAERLEDERRRWWRFYRETDGKQDKRSLDWRQLCAARLAELGVKISFEEDGKAASNL